MIKFPVQLLDGHGVHIATEHTFGALRRAKIDATGLGFTFLNFRDADGQDVTREVCQINQPHFAVSVDEIEVAHHVSLFDLESANAEDLPLIEWMQSSNIGEAQRFGGGAAPLVKLVRVA